MLDRHFYGLEEQHHKLEVIIDRFLTSQKGHSCIIYGVAKSGKVTSIRRALQNARQTHPTSFNETWIDGLEEETVGGVLARISDGRRNDILPQMIVIKKFERFAQNENQIVLYELLNSTMTKP
uniref:AAA_16 domain-containing protein n=1 Tax=Rhabditophanes sp. KR3021 TaxID=114890 RepID=A0AC35TWZ3_9BILA